MRARPNGGGRSGMHDFAWHLSEKMQHLLSAACRSELARTVQLYVPLSSMLQQMQAHLRVQATSSTSLLH